MNGPDLSLESQDPSTQYLDTNGHGTFMAGIIGGNDGQPGGYRGVAPDSRILSVKVGAANGAVDVSQVIAAIDWVVQHRNDNGMNIRVLNLSYGTDSLQPYTVDPLAFAVEQAWKAGIVVVTAAGNEGLGASLSDPAYDPNLISVGAADTMGTQRPDDQPAAFTSGVPTCRPTSGCASPTLLAPGAHMQGLRDPGSYIDQNNPGAALGDQYFRGSGTSEAAAFVTGAVALLLQKDPQLTPDQVKQLLVQSAANLRGVSPFVEGAGELDMRGLFKAVGPSFKPARLDGQGPDQPWSTGSGSLELSRGSTHLTDNGVVLQGEQDIFGQPFDSVAMAGLEADELELVGRHVERIELVGRARGVAAPGAVPAGRTAPGVAAPGAVPAGRTAPGAANSWSGSSWSGSSWSGSSWSGSSWSGSSWSGDGWLGASWG